jgi:spermidine synthase
MFGLGKKIYRSVMMSNRVEISEMDGVRSLYIDTNTIQSSMKVKAPYDLTLAYSRGMMAFLLFNDRAKQLLMIGLGGGSVCKYIWKQCPEITQQVIEISPQVIDIARSHFYVPDNDDRFEVTQADGLRHLSNLADGDDHSRPDLLMIDAFDGLGIPPDFCTQRFFDDCEAALSNKGLFVINLWGSDKKFDVYWDRMGNSFNGKLLKLPTGKPGNIIVFGFKGVVKPISMAQLMINAKALAHHEQLDFTAYVETLFEHNPHVNKQLLPQA